MKSLMLLWKEAADEMAAWCGTSTTLDYNKLERRVEHEGMEFLTITLPAFCKEFERALDEGGVSPLSFPGFARKDGLPLFLGGFLERVFDRGCGSLLDVPCIDSIFAVRQLTLMFAKILLPCSDARVEEAMRKYVECDEEVRSNDSSVSDELLEEFYRVSRILWADVLSDIDLLVFDGGLIPRHGPGATADKLRGNEKWNQSEWTERLEAIFPAGEFLLPNWRYHNQLDRVRFLEPGAERPAKVISVPKTLKTPRIIAVEPTCMQYAQQALLQPLVRRIEGDSLLDRMVGFTDQEPNRFLAAKGSSDGTLATLDLSEASDRVSNQHVRVLLRDHRWLALAVDACRTRKADVQGQGVIPLAKFASMGSALCFPFEAMVFTTLLFVGVQRQLSRPLTRKDVYSLRDQVRVYGDDIIVPVDYVQSVIGALQDFGLVVNTNKSFWTGKFRESCGGDFYDGHWVTPVRVRRVMPSARRDAQELISAVSLRNQLYYAGLWRTAGWLDERIGRILPHYPIIDSSSTALGRHSFLPARGEKMHADLHTELVRAFVPHSKSPVSPLDDEGALLKCLISLEQRKGDLPVADVEHLVRSGRPQSTHIKLRWIPVHLYGVAGG